MVTGVVRCSYPPEYWKVMATLDAQEVDTAAEVQEVDMDKTGGDSDGQPGIEKPSAVIVIRDEGMNVGNLVNNSHTSAVDSFEWRSLRPGGRMYGQLGPHERSHCLEYSSIAACLRRIDWLDQRSYVQMFGERGDGLEDGPFMREWEELSSDEYAFCYHRYEIPHYCLNFLAYKPRGPSAEGKDDVGSSLESGDPGVILDYAENYYEDDDDDGGNEGEPEVAVAVSISWVGIVAFVGKHTSNTVFHPVE